MYCTIYLSVVLFGDSDTKNTLVCVCLRDPLRGTSINCACHLILPEESIWLYESSRAWRGLGTDRDD